MKKREIGIFMLLFGLVFAYIINSASTTREIWKISLPGEVKTCPIETEDGFIGILGDDRLIKVDPVGRTTQTVPLKGKFLHPLVNLPSAVVVADRKGGITAYSKSSLGTLWEREVTKIQNISPFALPDNRVLLRIEDGYLLALSGETGNPIWQSRFVGEVVQISKDRVLGVVFGYTDLRNSYWKLSGVDIVDGEILWTHPKPIDERAPDGVNGYFVFCDQSGRPIVVDQETGEEKYRFEKDGYKIFGTVEDKLLLLAMGGSVLDCFSVSTGQSWSATLPSPLLDAFICQQKIILVDGKGVRCVNGNLGEILWQKDLGKTFNAFFKNQRLYITYKDSYIARETYFSCFRLDNGEPFWTISDQGIFWEPASLPQGDLIACRTGNVYLMPRSDNQPSSPSPSIISSPTIPVSIQPPTFFPDFFERKKTASRSSIESETPVAEATNTPWE